MGTTGFDQLAAAGVANAERQAQQRTTFDMLQRKMLADQLNKVAEAPLPADVNSPEYKQAIQQRSWALDQQQKIYSPEHHANLADVLHGLITGRQQGAQPPVSSSAPQPPGAPTAAPGHPFQPVTDPNHPLNKGQQFLDALGQHLKAAAHPIAPKPAFDTARLVDAQAQEENTARLQALADDKRKQENAVELADAKKRPNLKAYTLNGVPHWYDANRPEDIPSEAVAVVNTGKPKDSQAALATYIRAKYGENPTWQQIAEGTAEHQKLMAGHTEHEGGTWAYDDQGVPHWLPTHSSTTKSFDLPPDAKPPVSSAAPPAPGSLAAVNAGIKSGNATSPKLNKGKPVSAKAPVAPAWHKAGVTEKADASQYTKVAEDANSKMQAYTNASQAATNPTPTTDQELIYAWVRSNVQGAGRMTQAEFNQAKGIGSVPLKLENWIDLATSGKISPQMREYMLADIKRSATTAQKQADSIRNRIGTSSSAPQVPSSSDDDLKARLLKATQ